MVLVLSYQANTNSNDPFTPNNINMQFQITTVPLVFDSTDLQNTQNLKTHTGFII